MKKILKVEAIKTRITDVVGLNFKWCFHKRVCVNFDRDINKIKIKIIDGIKITTRLLYLMYYWCCQYLVLSVKYYFADLNVTLMYQVSFPMFQKRSFFFFCWKILFYKLKIGRGSFQNKSNTKQAAQHFSMQFGILSKCWKNIITLIISSTKSLSRVRPFRKIFFTVPVWTRSSSVYPSSLRTVQHPQVTSYQPVNRHTATVMLTLYAAAYT